MNEDIIAEVMALPRFQVELDRASRLAALSDLPAINADGAYEPVDWRYALLCCSILTGSRSEDAQDAVLRVTQACLGREETTPEQRAASALLLERLGNGPALRLAESRQLVPSDIWTTSPPPLGLEVLRSRLELSIPVSAAESLHVNRFQREFWSAASANTWLSVSAPTSAGKSFIVRQWIESAMKAQDAFRCVYVVPTRALIQEVSEELKQQLTGRVGVYTLPWDAGIGDRAQEVFVLTQERLHLLQQQDPFFAPNLTFVDEAQKFGDDARGVLLQQVLDESVARRPEGQVVFASPLSDNPEMLLEAVPEGTSRASLVGGTVTVTQNLFWVNQVKFHPQRWTVEMMTDRGPTSIGEVVLPARPSPASKRLPLLAVTLGRSSPSNVVYVNGAAAAEKAARQIYEALGPEAFVGDDADVAALRELSQKTIHRSYALNTCLQRGVAFHYGNMPLMVRVEIERLFRSGILRYLICTSTLLEGVNLPCKNLFVRGPRRGRGRVMGPADFWNLAGRAGRWGKEFQGNIFCVDTSDESQWPVAPASRVRYPLTRATDEVMSDVDVLISYIEAESPPEQSGGYPPLESVYSFLSIRAASGLPLAKLPGVAAMGFDARERLQRAVMESLDGLDVPPSLIKRHAGISPMSMQRLLEDFRGHDDASDLMISPPESDDAVDTIVSAFGRLQRNLGGNLGQPARQYMLALLVVNWMRGAPLARIIATRLGYLEERGREHKTANVIRECMADVEQIARFEAPRLLACYVDLLQLHLSASNMEERLVQLPDVAMLLELGVSRTTEVSMITLGLSRTTAIAVSEFIIEDDLGPTRCVEWLQAAELESLDLPELVRREIRALLIRRNLWGDFDSGSPTPE